MAHMTPTVKAKCHTIIHSASTSAGVVGAGLAQVPLSDNAVITPIQLAMIIALGNVFGIDISESSAKASLASLSAATIGRTISQVLIGWLPIAGNIINASTATTLTEGIGWMIVKDFSRRAAEDTAAHMA